MIDLSRMPRLLEPLVDNPIPIVMAADANYVTYISVALKSVLVNADPERAYEVVILDGGIPQYHRAIIGHMVEPHKNVTLRWADTRRIEEHYSQLYTRDHLSSAAYLRVFLPYVLPDYDRALYLDCDTVTLGDVAELMDLDMEDYYLGAAVCGSQLFDLEQSQVGGQTWLEYKTDRLGFVDEKFLRYFNSGVMLMNLAKLREDEIREELESLFGEEFLALDQDMLNLVGRDRSVRYFDPEWNVFPYPADRYTFGRERFPEFYEEVMAGRANPKVVHFLHTEKPLNRRVLYDHYYWHYSRMTPYHERGVEQYEANQRQVLRRNLLGRDATRALGFYQKWYTRLQRGRDRISGLFKS